MKRWLLFALIPSLPKSPITYGLTTNISAFSPVVQKPKKAPRHLLSSFHRPGLGCSRSWWTTSCSLAVMFDSFTFTKALSDTHKTCMDQLLVKLLVKQNHGAKLQSPVSHGSWIFRMGPNAWKLMGSVAASGDRRRVMSWGIRSHENARHFAWICIRPSKQPVVTILL